MPVLQRPSMPPEPAVAGVAVDPAEVAKFDAVAHRFWDPDGEFKPLHALNPLRAGFVAERCRLEGSRVRVQKPVSGL
jgi:2-polyprenyl-3-methyl-5-hydroxy-6-metoxy-1,4-benzoquinol methylase